jgi:hypothetical protein
MSEQGEGVIVQEVDVLRLIQKIGRKNKQAQAKILQRLETVIPDPEEYAEIRKFVLDEINNLTRAYVKETFGNIEFLIE